jgi:hypothetical protein
MLKFINATFCIILLQMLLQGCSPIYKTNYIYHPIKSEGSRACANECLHNKQNCRSQCLELQRKCEHDANMLAVASELIKNQSSPSTISSTRTNLLNDCYKHADQCELSCDEDHKLCHENCGGEVTVQRLCVKHCEKNPPAH